MVSALATNGNGTIYAGGGFIYHLLGSPSDGPRSTVTQWSLPGSNNPDGDVRALTTAKVNGDTILYLGGGFHHIGAARAGYGWTVANSIGQVNTDTWVWSALGSGLSGQVDALVTHGGGNLYAGGHFTKTGNGKITINHIAAWEQGEWHPLGSGINGDVYALAMGPAITIGS